MDGDIDPFIEAYLKRRGRAGSEPKRMSDELNFVLKARREKLDALDRARNRAVRIFV